ncbi:thiosulfate oxidation carrier protein SoxY [Thioalkalivibrio sp. ALJ24]|uniref:thiosulfate oxidation carrier protein SoxY n=1 Tax=Thioalkalivibrio sp. ALJ24 TaxID=545276 RepID=UPI0003805482|nr:thiosulfate oxidation carrier protein SoxY [Thioalkalivibrio sp. ALJ24]
MISTKRRVFLKGTLAAGTVGAAVGAGLLAPSKLLAGWSADMFDSEGVENSLNAVAGTTDIQESDDIELSAPEIAENGAVVPVSVHAHMDNVEEIAIMAEANNRSLASRYVFSSAATPKAGQRMRLVDTSDVIAAVKADGNWYMTSRNVEVTVGGCGG